MRPVLITCPAAAGTLAAVRALGRSGVPVTVAGCSLLNAARWSRFATDFWYHKPWSGEKAGMDTLWGWSIRSRGHVLLAASDETAWLFARNAEALSQHFAVYVPTVAVLETILDKEKLYRSCDAAGIATIEAWFPRDVCNVETIAPDLQYPVLIKPRSHLFRTHRGKGVVVASPAELPTAFAKFVCRERTGRSGRGLPQPPPIVQLFVTSAVENVISITGFIDREGSRTVLRASRKMLQRARPVGIGLVFEAIPVDPALADQALRLCRLLGFFGVFEIEFMLLDGRWRLIDFNPRFFHQLALDISTGAALPLLVYHDACGDLDALDEAVAGCSAPHVVETAGLVDGFTATIVLLLRMFEGRRHSRRVLQWCWQRRAHLVDVALDRSDRLPGIVHALSELRLGIAAIARLLGRKARRLPESMWKLGRGAIG